MGDPCPSPLPRPRTPPRHASAPFAASRSSALAFALSLPRPPSPADPNMSPEPATSIPPCSASPCTGPADKSTTTSIRARSTAPSSNQQATAMVDAAAALWSAVPTAGVTLIDTGSLNEDVSGANIVAGQLVGPDHRARRRHARGHQLSRSASSTTPTARSSTPSSARAPASPTSCQNNGVMSGSTTSTPTPPSPTPSSCSTASAPPTPICSR